MVEKAERDPCLPFQGELEAGEVVQLRAVWRRHFVRWQGEGGGWGGGADEEGAVLSRPHQISLSDPILGSIGVDESVLLL